VSGRIIVIVSFFFNVNVISLHSIVFILLYNEMPS
jgi:hypothetical protein